METNTETTTTASQPEPAKACTTNAEPAKPKYNESHLLVLSRPWPATHGVTPPPHMAATDAEIDASVTQPEYRYRGSWWKAGTMVDVVGKAIPDPCWGEHRPDREAHWVYSLMVSAELPANGDENLDIIHGVPESALQEVGCDFAEDEEDSSAPSDPSDDFPDCADDCDCAACTGGPASAAAARGAGYLLVDCMVDKDTEDQGAQTNALYSTLISALHTCYQLRITCLRLRDHSAEEEAMQTMTALHSQIGRYRHHPAVVRPPRRAAKVATMVGLCLACLCLLPGCVTVEPGYSQPQPYTPNTGTRFTPHQRLVL